MNTWEYINVILIVVFLVNKYLVFGLVFSELNDRVALAMNKYVFLSKRQNNYLLFCGLLKIITFLSVACFVLFFLYRNL